MGITVWYVISVSSSQREREGVWAELDDLAKFTKSSDALPVTVLCSSLVDSGEGDTERG